MESFLEPFLVKSKSLTDNGALTIHGNYQNIFVTLLSRGIHHICDTLDASTQFYTVDNAAVSLHRQESDHIDPI